jgi:hypothetical protein
VTHTAALIRECSRITTILLFGVVAGIGVWAAIAWVLLAIVGAIRPPVTANDLTWPSTAQMLAMFIVLMMLPVAAMAGGFVGWGFAIKKKG